MSEYKIRASEIARHIPALPQAVVVTKRIENAMMEAHDNAIELLAEKLTDSEGAGMADYIRSWKVGYEGLCDSCQLPVPPTKKCLHDAKKYCECGP